VRFGKLSSSARPAVSSHLKRVRENYKTPPIEHSKTVDLSTPEEWSGEICGFA
jgi:hypothetical protein